MCFYQERVILLKRLELLITKIANISQEILVLPLTASLLHLCCLGCILRRAALHWIRSLVTGLIGDGVSKVKTARLLTPLLEGLFKLYGLINSCLGAFLETGPEPSKSGPSLKLCPPTAWKQASPPPANCP